MTIDIYKLHRKTYKIVCFDEEHGVTIYKIEGRKNMKAKVKELKKVKKHEFLPRPHKVMFGESVHTQYANEADAQASLQFVQRTNPKFKHLYSYLYVA